MKKQLIIHTTEVEDQQLLGFELIDISKDEAIVMLNRCLHSLLNDYDTTVKILEKQA